MNFDKINSITGYRIEPLSDYKKGSYNTRTNGIKFLTKCEIDNRTGGKKGYRFG